MARALLFVLLLAAGACGRSEDPPPSSSTPPVDAVTQRYLQAAQQALEQRAYQAGLALADSAARRAPGLPDPPFLRGRLFFELGRFDEARAAYLRALALEADYPGGWHNLGNVAFRQRKYREALAYFRKEKDLHPAPAPWHALGGTFEALGQADSARWAYEQALAEASTYAPAHASLADWHEREGDFDAALKHARQGLALAPADLDLQYKVGALLFRTGRHEEAVERLRSVVAARPWGYGALFNLGQALQRLGRTEEAQTLLARADSVRNVQARVERLQREAQGQPGDFEKQVALADALRDSGRLAEALDAYHVAVDLRPNNLALRNNVATLYLQQGDTTEALTRYRQILQQDSTFAEAWLNLALYYARSGRRTAAERALDRAATYGADSPTVQAFMRRLQRQ